MLVLLIIFMVAAPLATVDVAVDLPASTAEAAAAARQAALPDRQAGPARCRVGNETVGRAALPGVLDASTNGDRDSRIFLRADKTVAYGELMQVMNVLRAAGYLKVALVGLEQASSP